MKDTITDYGFWHVLQRDENGNIEFDHGYYEGYIDEIALSLADYPEMPFIFRPVVIKHRDFPSYLANDRCVIDVSSLNIPEFSDSNKVVVMKNILSTKPPVIDRNNHVDTSVSDNYLHNCVELTKTDLATKKEFIRRKALAKLTDEEKDALNIVDFD